MLNFDDNRISRLLADLVNIDSVFPHEREAMLFWESQLKSLGLPVERFYLTEDRWNVLTRIGSDSPVLCLNAHMDTVPSNGASVPAARIEKDVMFGLGSADDKASVVAMLEAMNAIRNSGATLNGTLDLLVSVDEEGDGEGVRSAIDQGYRCDYAIVGEPCALEVRRTHNGIVFLEVVTHGKSAHGSSPWLGENAIDLMYEVVGSLRSAVTDYAPHDLVGPPTLNLGTIHGGDHTSRVPDVCQARIDIRLVPPMTVFRMLQTIERVFDQWRGKAEYRVIKKGDPLDTPADAQIIQAIDDAMKQVTGHGVRIAGMRGWTEAEPFRTKLGVESVVFGPGSLEQAHSANEFIRLDQVALAARLYAETVLRILV